MVAQKTLKAAVLAVTHYKSSSEPGTKTIKIGPRSEFDEKT